MTSSQQPILSTENALPELKGAPLAVLLALWRDGPAGRKGLTRRTGWKKDAVGAALKRLVRLKLVVRHSHCEWGVAQGVSVPQLLGIVGINGERPQENPQGAGESPQENPQESPQRRQKRRSRREERENGSSPAGGHERNARSSAVEERFNRRRANGGMAPEVRENGSPGTALGRGNRRDGRRFYRSDLEQEAHDEVAGSHARDDHDLIDDPLPDPDLNENKIDDYDQEERGIIQSLQALNPPFDNARAWLRTVPLQLVADWLAYLETMPPSQRNLFRNEAAFIRSRVRDRLQPPTPRTDHAPSDEDDSSQTRAPRSYSDYRELLKELDPDLAPYVEIRDKCPDCGWPYYDDTGDCLVCLWIFPTLRMQG